LIRSILYLEVRDGDYESLVDHFKTAGILERSRQKPGCHGAEIALPCAGQGPVLVTALWDSISAYESWRNDPWRVSSSPGLNAHLVARSDEPPAGVMYRIVHEATLDDEPSNSAQGR